MVINLHSLFLSICACSGLESTTAFGGDCLEVIEFVSVVLDASSTLNKGWPDGADELPRLSPVKNNYQWTQTKTVQTLFAKCNAINVYK